MQDPFFIELLPLSNHRNSNTPFFPCPDAQAYRLKIQQKGAGLTGAYHNAISEGAVQPCLTSTVLRNDTAFELTSTEHACAFHGHVEITISNFDRSHLSKHQAPPS
ncbi:hypothetical protein N7451_008569 [Penicillium sp. IBT 35674x]|nr:hypothetical protein N7451_008569 [Penicillium sp. IBT 35674x]